MMGFLFEWALEGGKTKLRFMEIKRKDLPMNIFSKTKLEAYWPKLTRQEIRKLLCNSAKKVERNLQTIIMYEEGQLTAKPVNFQYFFKRDYLVEVRETLSERTDTTSYFAIFFTKVGNFYLVKCERKQSEDGHTSITIGGLSVSDAPQIAAFLAYYELTSLHAVSYKPAYSFNNQRNIYY